MRRVSSAAIRSSFTQDSQRPERDVFQISDWRSDQKKRAGHGGRLSGIVPLRFLPTMYSSEPLPHFVDDYLRYLQETRPTSPRSTASTPTTTCSRISAVPAIDADFGPSPASAPRLADIDPSGLTEIERAEHPVLKRPYPGADVRARGDADLGAQPAASTPTPSPRAWRPRRSSRYAPDTERARRVLSKLRQAPRLIQAARDNVKDPPGIFVKVGIETFNGAQRSSR